MLIAMAQERVTYYEAQQATINQTLAGSLKEFINNYNNELEISNLAEVVYNNSNTLLNENYQEYAKKATHYINLLYNDQAGAISIPSDVIITLPEDYSKTYDVGLGYAIQNYRQNKIVRADIGNYGSALAQASNFLKSCNKHFNCFVLVAPGSDYKSRKIYYLEDLTTKYVASTKAKWYNDINAGKVYECITEPLLDVIPTIFIESTGSDKQQYAFVKNKYVKTDDTVNTYEIKDNGGLSYILNVNNAYITDLKNNYKESLALYDALLEEKNNLQDNLAALDKLYNKYNNDIKALKAEQAKYQADDTELSNADIYNKLSEYLRKLTIKYVDQVERRYELL